MSELALQLIRKEKEERTGKLDLGYCGLNDFPEELFELEWLEELNLSDEYWDHEERKWIKSHNKGENNFFNFKRIPDAFVCFQQLKVLRIGAGWRARGKLNDCFVLENLSSMTSLDLSSNQISDIRFLKNLTCLTSIDLSYNQISDIRFLEKLTSLTSLNLNGNQISDIRFLEKLTSLTRLYIEGNKISDYSFLENLTSLTSLHIEGNKISDYSFLENLTSLTSLSFSENQISDIRFLEKLPSLTSLDLSSKQIHDYSFLEKLPSLTNLDLGGNEINDCSFLEKLTSLTSLDLVGNQISDIRFLEKLTSLTSLSLSFNEISDIRFLENLTSLTFLDLSFNQISDCSLLKNLTSLTSLSLSDNQISDISFLENLTSLASLNLNENQISDISFLENLTNLIYLDLSGNKINDIRGLIPIMKRSIPVNLKEFGGRGISLYANPIGNPPMNIVEQGTVAILAYFEQLEREGTENLYEGRIVIVGESGAGKTTLFKKLKDVKSKVPDPKQGSTHGININPERVFKHKKGVNIKTSIWDFGGQDTQNYLHQYFYAKDNLFLLVCDHRAEKYRFDYWFEMITRLCAESSVIIVRNQNERVTAGQALNLKEYEERFPSLKLNHVEVDFKDIDARWDVLIQTIEDNLSVMQRVNQKVPKNWKPIRDAIEKKKKEKRPYISYSEYEEICFNNDLKEIIYQNQCLDYLHWLGYALHYDDMSLINTIFIDPEWITKGLYEILREENYKAGNKGRFTQHDISKIWRNKSTSDQNLLLSLLLKDRFEVCYKVENTNKYLVPVLISNIQSEPEKIDTNPYTLRFKFPFMPFGFFSRLIVRLYDKIWDDHVWLTGVWLKDENNCMARMEHLKDINTGDEVFEISIYGEKKERKDLLSEIRTEIFHIRKLLFPNLIIEEQIPCFCEVCLTLKTPYFHNRIDLDRMAKRNQFASQCKNGGELIPTDKLLDSIINTEELKKQFKAMAKEGVSIDFKPRIEVKPKTKQVQKTKVKAEAEADAKAEAMAKNEVSITIQHVLAETDNLKKAIEKDLKIKKVPKEEIEYAKADVEDAEEDFREIEQAQQEKREPSLAAQSRLHGFIKNLIDENSSFHKTLKMLRTGKDYGVKIARAYNEVAQNLALPSMPPVILDVLEKL